jgi:hypothetical protein
VARTFEIASCLGRGGFGEVYRARLRRAGFETEVALKLLHADVDPRGQAVERLRDEARLLGLLRHRAIPRVLDLVELEGRLALVSEYVEGADLSRCLRADPPLSIRACVEIAADVADALHTAWHAATPDGRPARIVHRDLKPANVRVARDGAVKLLDFGIAWTDEITRAAHTQTEALVGSPAYMAPERFDGAVPDPAQDVFSLGAVLYEALTRRKLFDDLAFRAMAALALFEDRYERALQERLAELPAAAPAPLVDVLRAMLAWSPARRPSAGEVATRLDALGAACPGVSLSAWCRARDWPADPGRSGPWVGRTLTDAAPVGTPDELAPTELFELEVEPLTDTTRDVAPPRGRRTGPLAALAGVLVLAVAAVGVRAWVQIAVPTAVAPPRPAVLAAPVEPPTVEPPPVEPPVQAPSVEPPAPTPAARAASSGGTADVARAARPTRPATASRATPAARAPDPEAVDADRARLVPTPRVEDLADEPVAAAVPARATPAAPPAKPAEPAQPPRPVGTRVVLDPASGALVVHLAGRSGALYDLPATVPPGDYRVLVEETAGVPTFWNSVVVPARDRVTIRCALKTCRGS